MTRKSFVALSATALLALFPVATDAASKKPLKGTLVLTAGKKTKSGKAKYGGTYFRMILPGAKDKYFENPDSRATDKTYTLLRPGSDRGMKLGAFQAPPNPAFDGSGNARAHRIALPEKFAGIKFSISTAAKDAQSGAAVTAPKLYVTRGKVSGDLRAWTAEWNTTYFNQGAPKPNGTFPGFTRPVNGTYNTRTHAFEIAWYSSIVGGPFNGFTGYWHLQGRLK